MGGDLIMATYKKILLNVLALISLIAFLFPIFIMFNLSFKSNLEIMSWPFKWFNFKPIVTNYKQVFILGSFGQYIINTFTISIGNTILVVLFGTTAAYAIARYKILNQNSALLLLFMRMIPPVAIMTPIFLIMKDFNLLDTYHGLILVYAAFNLPLAIWMMIGFFADVPRELEEAAYIDGCGKFRTFWQVILPIVRGGLVATLLLCLVMSWNEFPYAFIASGRVTRPIAVAALSFKQQEGIYWGEVMAVGSIAFTPMLILALLFQKNLIKGMTMGSVKG
jgi:multiple sugar transport system permease protein